MSSRSIAWRNKFLFALRGLGWSIRTQSSFHVHLPVAAAVMLCAALLGVEVWRWAVLIVVITLVLAFELINTALEQFVLALHPEHDQRIGWALDAAAAAVLVMSVGSVVVGIVVLGPPLWEFVAGR